MRLRWCMCWEEGGKRWRRWDVAPAHLSNLPARKHATRSLFLVLFVIYFICLFPLLSLALSNSFSVKFILISSSSTQIKPSVLFEHPPLSLSPPHLFQL